MKELLTILEMLVVFLVLVFVVGFVLSVVVWTIETLILILASIA